MHEIRVPPERILRALTVALLRWGTLAPEGCCAPSEVAGCPEWGAATGALVQWGTAAPEGCCAPSEVARAAANAVLRREAPGPMRDV